MCVHQIIKIHQATHPASVRETARREALARGP
jgi:hypothetical protein